MALWQFTVFAVLIGFLLLYAGILTRRISHANAALKRIEEALLLRSGLAAAPAPAEVVAAAAPSPETTSQQGDVARYLTVRDLKAGSTLQSSRANRSNNDAATEESMRLALMSTFAARRERRNAAASAVASDTTGTGDATPSAETPVSWETAATPTAPIEASADPVDTLTSTGELSILQASPDEPEDSVTAGAAESSDAPTTAEELPSSPVADAEDEDAAAKKALLFRNNQRRRRRARQGF